MQVGGINKKQIGFWRARKRSGLSQKQIAYLLDRRSSGQISRYENGSRLPTLQIALKLEIIFGVPIRHLFSDFYTGLWWEIKKRAGAHRSFEGVVSGLAHLCSYSELLDLAEPTSEDIENIRTHVLNLQNRFSEFLAGKRDSSA